MVSSEVKQILKRETEQIPTAPNTRRKISNDKFFVPLINEASEFAKYNYNLAQLKQIAKHYKLPVSGTKTQLTTLIYNFFRLSEKTVIIQSAVRGYFTRKVLKMRGPALMLKNRGKCTNETDFFTLTDLKEIPYSQFYSFACPKGFIYGFDISSLFQMFVSTGKDKRKGRLGDIMNPYNREIIKPNIFKKMKNIKKLSTLFGMNTNVELLPTQNENEIIGEANAVFNYDQEVLRMCQILDGFGNYTDTAWFINLSRSNIIRFIRELHDIWCYRAQISQQVKIAICPPNGNPFINLRNHTNTLNTMSDIELKKNYLKIIENIITKAHDDSNKTLGGMYVLTALTITSPAAAAAMPWLYESVMN